MKYKLLLVGKSSILMDVFFTNMRDNFECLSSTVRSDDILNHLKLFTPDAMVYCLNKDTPENFSQVVACKTLLAEKKVPLLVMGSDIECEEFANASSNMGSLELTKPFTASLLTKNILQFFNHREKIAARDQAIQQKIREQEQKQKQEEAEQRKHILVIDDDPLILRLVREHLHKEYEVGTALSGKVAMKFLEKKKVDLILLDFEMPEENGPAVLQKLHANEETKDIPVIFLTGITDRGKVKEALSQKPQDYVLKPIDRNRLMDAILKVIR